MELLNPEFEHMLLQLKQHAQASCELAQLFGCPSSEPLNCLTVDLATLADVKCEDLLAKFFMLDKVIRKVECHSLRCFETDERRGLIANAFNCRTVSERLASRLVPLMIAERPKWNRHLAELRLLCGIHAANLDEWLEAKSFALASLELEADEPIRRRAVGLLQYSEAQLRPN